MKRILLLVFGLFSIISTFAQPQANFPTTTVNMGTLTWNYAGLATFDIVNTGNENLVIEDVHPDCGCTAVAWTHEPIRPGEAGTINVTYNAEMLGRFSKGVEVWTNALELPVYLVVMGNVVKERKEYSGNFPYRIGDIYLNTDEVEFDDVHRGTYPGLALMVYNGSDKDYAPTLMHLPKYLTATYQPELIRPGRVGRIILGLDSEKLFDYGLTQTDIYLSRYPGDKVKSGNEIKVSATLLPEISLSPAEWAVAPRLSVDTATINLRSSDRRRKSRTDLLLRNVGRSDLEIRKLLVYDVGVSASLNKQKLEAGESARLRISVDGDFSNTKGRARVLLITNDPEQPTTVINLLVNKRKK